MTFQEALNSLRDPNGNASPEGLALAEQVEANRLAIEELRSLENGPWLASDGLTSGQSPSKTSDGVSS